MVCVELRVVDASVGLAVLVGTSVTGVIAGVSIQAGIKRGMGDIGDGIGAGNHMMCISHPPLQPIRTAKGKTLLNQDVFTHVTGVLWLHLHWSLDWV